MKVLDGSGKVRDDSIYLISLDGSKVNMDGHEREDGY